LPVITRNATCSGQWGSIARDARTPSQTRARSLPPGRFKWSSQRLTLRSCAAQEKPRFGSCRCGRDAVGRTPTGWASGRSGPVLGGDRSKGIKRGCRRGSGCLAEHWCPVVLRGWRDAAAQPHAGVWALSVFAEPEEIAVLLAGGCGVREIARFGEVLALRAESALADRSAVLRPRRSGREVVRDR
jgi:hypothetical protein